MAPPPLDRKHGRAAWAEEQSDRNKRFRQERLTDETLEEGDVLITVEERGCMVGDSLYFDLRQDAGTFFGTLLHHAGVDWLNGFAFKYEDSESKRKRWLRNAAEYELFRKDVLAQPVRSPRR